MKTLSIIAVTLLMTCLTHAQDKGHLTVSFDQISQNKGELYIGVFEKDNFLRQPKIGKTLKVSQKNNQVIFENLPHGEYAISVFQDLNANQQFDMDEYGRPAEPWVMSGNVNPEQMPIWDDAKFEFDTASKTIALKL